MTELQKIPTSVLTPVPLNAGGDGASSLQDKSLVTEDNFDRASYNALPAKIETPITNWKAAAITSTVTGVTIMNSMLTGLLIVALPTMAKELDLGKSLLLWPSSVNAYVLSDMSPIQVTRY
jgi:hypothetical protein